MKNRTLFMCVVFLLAATAWAGLNDPVLLNPSFEADVLAPATKTSAITDWWNRTSYCWATEETSANFPPTPYGSNWVEFGNGSWVYQQIGTWEADMAMEVSLLVGSVATKTFPGVYASLWVGGDPGAASDAGAKNPTTLESAVGATQIAISGLIKPALTGAATSEESVILSTGSGQTEGTPLWLLIQSAGAQRTLIDNIAVRQLAVSPESPPMGSETPVSVDAVLRWNLAPGYTVTGYDVWFGTDPNENLPNYGLTKIVDKELVTTKDPAPSAWTANEALDYETDYSWRVDIYEPNAPGPDMLTEGVLYNFTTEPPEPQITGGPVGATVAAGDSAVFTVETLNVETWQWHKVGTGALSDDGKFSGTDSASLTVSSVGLSDEGSYYCVVSNTVSQVELPSGLAQLMTTRLVGWWKLDGNLADSVTYEVPGAPSHDGTASDPNLVAGGIDGGAYEFFDDGRVVTIADSNDFFNFYPGGITVNAWTNIDAANSFATVLSKRNNAQDAGWMLRCPDTASFQVQQATQEAANGQDSLADSQWHMLTGQYDGSTVKVFVDGVLVAETEENTNVIGTHPEALVFGAARPDGGGSFLGLVDDIRIWSYALSPEAIAKLYANMTGESVCLGIPLYDFNESCAVNFADFVEIARTWQNSNIVNP